MRSAIACHTNLGRSDVSQNWTVCWKPSGTHECSIQQWIAKIGWWCWHFWQCHRFTNAENDDIFLPKVYRRYTTKRVLCLERIEGDMEPWAPLDEARRRIRVGVQCLLQQQLDKGFGHADPHGGNLLRTKDGKPCYLDFGMGASVGQRIWYDLIAAIVCLVNRDYDNLPDSFVKLGFLPKGVDTSPFVLLLSDAFGDASTGSSLSDLSFSRLANNQYGLAFAKPICIPEFFNLIIR